MNESMNFKDFCDRAYKYGIWDIFEAVNAEIYKLSKSPFEEANGQYKEDLLLLLKLYVGSPLPKTLRQGYLEEAFNLLLKLSKQLVALENFDDLFKANINKKNGIDSHQDHSIVIVISKEEVEEGDIEIVRQTVDKLLDKRRIHKLKNKVSLCIQGFDDTSLELFEIPIVRNYIYELDKYFPYWFYFLSQNTDSLKVITMSLCGVINMGPGLTKLNQDHFSQFLNFHFHHLNILADYYEIDEAILEQISEEILVYYGI